MFQYLVIIIGIVIPHPRSYTHKSISFRDFILTNSVFVFSGNAGPALFGRTFERLGIREDLVAALGGKDEPTSHAVRQLEAVKAYLNAWGRPVVITGNARPKGLENAVFGTDPDGKVARMLAAGCHSDASTLPVVALCDSFGRIVYFSQGYNTSLGEDLKRVIDEL